MLQEALRRGIIELVLRTVMYLIRYFQGVKCVDCQTNDKRKMSILSEGTLLESGKLFKKNFQSRSSDT